MKSNGALNEDHLVLPEVAVTRTLSNNVSSMAIFFVTDADCEQPILESGRRMRVSTTCSKCPVLAEALQIIQCIAYLEEKPLIGTLVEPEEEVS